VVEAFGSITSLPRLTWRGAEYDGLPPPVTLMPLPSPPRELDPRAGLDAAIAEFEDLPVEAILKQDVLRCGLQFDPAALLPADYKAKDYFIFSFDMVPGVELSDAERNRAPEEIKIAAGPHELAPTVISVRLNPASPYLVVPVDGRLALTIAGTALADVTYHPVPAYYGQPTASGKSVSEIAPAIEWGYLLYLTVFRMCQYFGKEEECQFCDINHNYRQQRQAGRPYTGVKEVSEIVDALRLVAKHDTTARAYTLTGGSITTQLAGQSEVDFYVRYIEAIESEFPDRWISKLVAQAQPPDQIRRLDAAGLRILHPNYEVWDARMFRLLCPGKDRVVGRDRWLRWTLEAADILGPERVIPNFVAGAELAHPDGFSTAEEAVASAAEGLDHFMSHGVVPRFTTWCPEPYTPLGDRPPASLRYYGLLLRAWRAAFERHALPVPIGYGRPGPGNAVFSVSAFMDVIRVADDAPTSDDDV